MNAFKTETIEAHGFAVLIEYFYDDYLGYPWNEDDGCGVIEQRSSYHARPSKAPGEVILHSERGEYFIYDVQASMEKAKREGWGIAGETARVTKKQAIREAVLRDMARCRKWLTGDLFYVGIVVTVLDADGEKTEDQESCWGFEYGHRGNDADYAESEAREMAESLARSVFDEKRRAWREALSEARKRKYWASRDVVTL